MMMMVMRGGGGKDCEAIDGGIGDFDDFLRGGGYGGDMMTSC